MWRSPFTLIFAALMLLVMTAPAAADVPSAESGTTPTDIEELRRQAEQEGWTYTVGETPATRIGLEHLCGLVIPENWRETGKFRRMLPDGGLPGYFNWCDRGACPQVRHQGMCGSCWAFGSMATLESNILIKDGIEVDLSEQWLISCNRNDYGCAGGWIALPYFGSRQDACGQTGVVSEDVFPYRAADVPCGCPHPRDYQVHDWAFVASDDEAPPVDQIKYAIMMHGPVTTGVCVNSAFSAYTGGIFNGPSCTRCNHAIALVGWDDEQGTDGVWFLRNSWGAEWGEDGYMRIEYGVSLVGEAAAFVDYRGTPAVRITLPDSTPRIVPSGMPIPIEVRMQEIRDELVGTGSIHYRLGGSDFEAVPLSPTGIGTYSGIVPTPACGDTVYYYLSAEGVASGWVRRPRTAPAETYWSVVGGVEEVLSDDFDGSTGWTVENSAYLTEGSWIRVIPKWRGSWGDPPTDYDGSGRCYLTGWRFGEDVDGGYTWLISPTMDLTGGDDAWISYAVWYTNNLGRGPNTDLFKVHVSGDDGATWTLVHAIGPMTRSGWRRYNLMLREHLAVTDRMRVRFEASDCHVTHHIEAAVDDFRAGIYRCTAAPHADLSSVGLTHESGAGLTTCPAGDGPAYRYLRVTLNDASGTPIHGLTADHFAFRVTPVAGCAYTDAPSIRFLPEAQITDANGEILFAAVGDNAMVGDVEVEVTAAAVTLASSSVLACKSFDNDLSGYVDLEDLLQLLMDYGTSAWRSDFDWDGMVDTNDYGLFEAHYLHGTVEPPGGEALMTRIDSLIGVYDASGGNIDLYGEALDLIETGQVESSPAVAGALSIQAWPNPSSGCVSICFGLPMPADCSCKIYDVRGQLVTTLVDETYLAGRHLMEWDGRDRTGRVAASGIYFCRLQAASETLTTKLTLSR
jgi:hypothetical protein